MNFDELIAASQDLPGDVTRAQDVSLDQTVERYFGWAAQTADATDGEVFDRMIVEILGPRERHEDDPRSHLGVLSLDRYLALPDEDGEYGDYVDTGVTLAYLLDTSPPLPGDFHGAVQNHGRDYEAGSADGVGEHPSLADLRSALEASPWFEVLRQQTPQSARAD